MLVDGEHYPPVIAAALEEVRAAGREIAAIVLVGGREKLPSEGLDSLAGLEVTTGDDPREVLDRTLERFRPEVVIDLSDEPVLDYRRRHELAAVALARGIPYEGADFSFTPPPRPVIARKASIAIIGTGKRTGKTAVAGFAARRLVTSGRRPVMVAMGRGGPDEPEVVHGDEISLTPEDLIGLAEQGKHAASDYIEDALLARVTTVGCRRCGGGLAGGVESSNVGRGAELANLLPGDLILFEGSGSAIPPVYADVTGLVVPASIPLEYLIGYMGPYRLLLSDFVVVTMCEEPFGSPPQISTITSRIRSTFHSAHENQEERGEIKVVRTVFRPHPTSSVEGAAVYVATTAPEVAGESIRRHLEERHGCRVVGMSHSLSNRARLEEELGEIKGRADVMLCEIKAAGIDVATRRALDAGLEVVYLDNVPEGLGDDDPGTLVDWAADLADRRFERAS